MGTAWAPTTAETASTAATAPTRYGMLDRRKMRDDAKRLLGRLSGGVFWGSTRKSLTRRLDERAASNRPKLRVAISINRVPYRLWRVALTAKSPSVARHKAVVEVRVQGP